MTQETSQQSSAPTSAIDNIRQITEAGEQLLEAGKQITDSLSDLSNRVEHASTVGTRIVTSPWLFIAATVVIGAGLIMTARRA